MDKPETITRRALLKALPAAGAIVALPVAVFPAIDASAAPAAPREPVENPALHDLAARLDRAVAEHCKATTARSRAVRKWRWQWPLAPDEITRPSRLFDSQMERNLLGWGITRAGESHPRVVETADDLRRRFINLDRALRRKRKDPSVLNWYGDTVTRSEAVELREELHGRFKIAESYEAELNRIRAASRIKALSDRQTTTELVLVEVISAIMEQAPAGREGIAIMARAAAATEHVSKVTLMLRSEWTTLFGKAVLRVLAGAGWAS